MIDINKRQLVALAKEQIEKSLSLLKSAVEKRKKDFKEAPSARDTWSDTTRSQTEGLISGLNEEIKRKEKILSLFNGLDMEPSSVVKPGSLVEVQDGDEIDIYLLVPSGGNTVDINDKIKVQLVSMGSVIASALYGHKVGDKVEVKLPVAVKKMEILSLS